MLRANRSKISGTSRLLGGAIASLARASESSACILATRCSNNSSFPPRRGSCGVISLSSNYQRRVWAVLPCRTNEAAEEKSKHTELCYDAFERGNMKYNRKQIFWACYKTSVSSHTWRNRSVCVFPSYSISSAWTPTFWRVSTNVLLQKERYPNLKTMQLIVSSKVISGKLFPVPGTTSAVSCMRFHL